MMENRNVDWVDWVKFCCIFFVYWNHVGKFSINKDFLSWFYGPFFVNAFFFISGYLIFRKQFSEKEIRLNFIQFWNKNFKYGKGMFPNIVFRIAVPSIIFSLLLFIPRCIIRGEPIEIIYIFKTTLLRGTYWFTCCLFVAEFIIFSLLLTRIKYMVFYVLFTSILAYLGNYLINLHFLILEDEYLPWFFKSGLIASFFLTLGGLYQEYEHKIDVFFGYPRRMSYFYSLVLFLCYIITIICRINIHEKTSCLSGVNIWGISISLFAILTIVYICKMMRNYLLVKYISRNTISFYFLSALVPFVCCKMVDYILPISFIAYIVEVLLSFSIALFVVYLLNSFIPFLFDLRILFKHKYFTNLIQPTGSKDKHGWFKV